jgi:hypothetical protein
MRKLTCFLLAGCAAASAADTWRWVDANGVTHFSDQPVPGAEKVQLQSAPKPGSVAPKPAPQATASNQYRPQNYGACRVTSPENEQVFNSVNAVSAAIDLQPELQPGHRVRVYLNGRTVGNWPDDALSHMLTDLSRGSYTVSVQVLDESGRPVCSGAGISFHVRQPSLLAPIAPPQPRGGNRGVPGVPGVPSVPRSNTPR